MKNPIKRLRTYLIQRRDPLFWIKRPLPYTSDKQVKKAKKMAMKAHNAFGCQFHIMPMGKDEAIIINNDWRKHYNRLKGVRKVSCIDLYNMAYFSTPSKRVIS